MYQRFIFIKTAYEDKGDIQKSIPVNTNTIQKLDNWIKRTLSDTLRKAKLPKKNSGG